MEHHKFEVITIEMLVPSPMKCHSAALKKREDRLQAIYFNLVGEMFEGARREVSASFKHHTAIMLPL